MKDKLLAELRLFITNYIVSPALGILICILEAFGRIRFLYFNRFPIWEESIIMVSNHPSLLEPFVLPLMGFPWMNFPWAFSPVWSRINFSLKWLRELRKEFNLHKKLIPANVPDRQNFYDPLFVGLFQGINVPVHRNGKAGGRIRTISALKDILENGGRILIFPEGTRTFKAAAKFKHMSAEGKELGKLKDGAAWLALQTNARILPIWVVGTDKVLKNNKFPFPRLWHKVVIKIGNPFFVEGMTRKEATEKITKSLLELADENGKKNLR